MKKSYIHILATARNNAFVPDSNFALAALAISSEKHFSIGVNWESLDRSIGTCGEMAAIMNMVSCNGPFFLNELYMTGGNKGREDMNALYSPCAACRQFMLEVDEGDTATLTNTSLNDKVEKKNLIASMMPEAFVFRNYIKSPIASYASSKQIPDAPEYLRGLSIVKSMEPLLLHKELLNTAYRSFAPDESYLQGAIIKTASGRAYCGSLFQTANFKDTKNAVIAALAMMISFDGVQDVDELHFLHIEKRDFFKGDDGYFPFEMLEVLRRLNCKKVYLYSENGISGVFDVNCENMPFYTMKKLSLSVSLNSQNGFSIPKEFRGFVF